MDIDKEGVECGRGVWAGSGRAMGEKWGQLQLNNNKKIKKEEKRTKITLKNLY